MEIEDGKGGTVRKGGWLWMKCHLSWFFIGRLRSMRSVGYGRQGPKEVMRGHVCHAAIIGLASKRAAQAG